MTASRGLSLDEIMISNVINITKGKDLTLNDRESIYDVAAKLAEKSSSNKRAFTSPKMSVRFLREKYANNPQGYTRGVMLLDSQHRLQAVVETPFMIAKEMLSLAIKHKAAAMVSFDVRYEGKLNMEREFSTYTNKVMASIDVRHLDHLEINFADDEFISHAEKGWL